MLRRIVRDPRNLPFVLSVVAALLIAPEVPSPAARPTSGWRGWYLLRYREDAAPVLESALPKAAAGAVNRAAALARLDAFSEIESVPVAALAARLDPLDPRWDSWLSGVGRYFQSSDDGPWSLVAYLPANLGRIAAGRRLARAFAAAGVPRGSWRLLELEPLAMVCVPVAALGFAIVIAAYLRRRLRGSLLLATAGWLACLPSLLNGGLPDVLFSCTLLYLWMVGAAGEAQERGHGSLPHPGRTGARIGVLLGVAGLIVFADGAAVYRVTRMCASLLCLWLLAGLRRDARASQPPAAAGPQAFRAGAHPRPPTPGVRAVRGFPGGRAPRGAPRGPVPVQRTAAARRLPLARRKPRWHRRDSSAGGADTLPGLAQAVSHAASLQTASFGAVAGSGGTGDASTPLPPREGRVLLREYAPGSAGGSLIEAPRTVARFDPGWLDRIVAGFGAGSVERLLIDQRHTVETRLASPRAAFLRAVPAALACLVLFGAPLAGPAARRLLIRLGLWAITEPARRRRTR